MIVDLHAHYPMHLMDESLLNGAAITVHRGFKRKPLNFIQQIIMKLCNNIFNYPAFCEPAVTIENLKNGNVMVALSVLYAPFDEMDLTKPYASAPEPGYFEDLKDQLQSVELEIEKSHNRTAVIAHDFTELNQAILDGKVALIHAVEGGFHLGDSDDQIKKNVSYLAGLGVAYITVAHLFFRQVATNAPAIPFLADGVYEFFFPEMQCKGLCDRGRTLIREMVKNGILIDITHMSDDSIDDTFKLLKDEFPNHQIPVIATHSACRFDGLRFKYNITPSHIQKVSDSGGLIGLIACKHYMSEGLADPQNFDDSIQIIFEHIDRIFGQTGSYDNIALGSDLDGFIKPSLPGLETPLGYAEVEKRLAKKYTPSIAKAICSDNALRVLKQVWRNRVEPETNRSQRSKRK